MAVGTGGVSAQARRAISGQPDTADYIWLAKNPGEVEKVFVAIAEARAGLQAATEEHDAAALRHGKADQLDQLLAEAKEAVEEAQKKAMETVRSASAEAAGIVEGAQTRANGIVTEATIKAADANGRVSDVAEREDAVSRREADVAKAAETAAAALLKGERLAEEANRRMEEMRQIVNPPIET